MGIGGKGGFFNELGQWMIGDPAEGAQGYLSQIPGEEGKYLNPYMQAGMGALPGLQQQYGALTADPGGVLSKIGAGFKASPGYQYNVQQATEGAKQAAAAGGMAGSPQSQTELAKAISGMASQDYGNYMQRALGLYGTGLKGEQGLYGTGFQAAGGMASSIQRMLEQQAQAQYAAQASQSKAGAGLVGQVLGAAGTAALFL